MLKIDGTQMQTGRRLNIVKDKDFDGPLPEVVEGARQLIASLLREFQVLGEDARFRTVPEYPEYPEYPEFAWFEGLVNAVAHRDYSIRGEYTRVVIFDDRLEITSPGILPNRVTLENMRTTRFARNPKICHVLASFKWVRELNEGVHRVYQEMEELGLPDPEFSEPSDFSVRLVLHNDIGKRVPYMSDSIGPKAAEERRTERTLSDAEVTALNLAESEGRVTTARLMQSVGVSRVTASSLLKRLVEKGRLVWHGTGQHDPNQYYSQS